jgi:hypothetical protein
MCMQFTQVKNIYDLGLTDPFMITFSSTCSNPWATKPSAIGSTQRWNLLKSSSTSSTVRDQMKKSLPRKKKGLHKISASTRVERRFRTLFTSSDHSESQLKYPSHPFVQKRQPSYPFEKISNNKKKIRKKS